MAVEEELKRDHAEMQAVIDAKQKIIDAQVLQMTILTSMQGNFSVSLEIISVYCLVVRCCGTVVCFELPAKPQMVLKQAADWLIVTVSY